MDWRRRWENRNERLIFCSHLAQDAWLLHGKDIREYTIDGKGMHIGVQCKNVIGMLAGHPQQVSPHDIERLGGLFKEEDPA